MEISLRGVSKVSHLSDHVFTTDDEVTSYLIRTEAGELDRIDVLVDEASGWNPEGVVLCRWTHPIKEVDETDAAAKRLATQSAEELFLALLDANNADEATEDDTVAKQAEEDRAVLLSLLALMLERKRVIRARPGRTGLYWHVKLKKELKVPKEMITPEQLMRIEAELGSII